MKDSETSEGALTELDPATRARTGTEHGSGARPMETSSNFATSPSPGIRRGDPGRVATYAILSSATGVVPVPWLPDTLARSIRGAMVHDIARRTGVIIPMESRGILSEPAGTEGPRSPAKQVAQFAFKKVLGRFGPAAFLPPVKVAMDTFVLGHLLERYIAMKNLPRGAWLSPEEARRLRHAMDQSVAASVNVKVPEDSEDTPLLFPEDRDFFTAAIDAVLNRTASAPSWLIARLDAAFDSQLAAMGTWP